MKPKISFVMPCRNCEAYITDSFKGLIQQNLKQIEIIVFDDASEDGTLDVIGHFAKKDKRIKTFFNKEQKGAAWCRNQGNQLAQADIICVTDAGDLYHKNRARATFRYFNKYPEIDIFSSGVEVIDAIGRHLKYEFPRLLDTSYGKKPSICHPTVGYRKKVIDKVKYRELTVHSDLYEAFLLEAIKAKFKHGFVAQVYVKKRYMPEVPGHRDIVEAWKFKRKIYEEFGIPLPSFLKGELSWKRITKYRY